MSIEERTRQVNESGLLIPTILGVVAIFSGWVWLNSPALDAERAPAETMRATDQGSAEIPMLPEAEEPNWVERAWVSLFGEPDGSTPESTTYTDGGAENSLVATESQQIQSEPGLIAGENGYYSITTSDGTRWSCGTLYNPKNTDHVLNVPEAWFPEDIFKRLDFDGVIEGPFMIDFHVRQEVVDSLDAEVMHRVASGAGACILEDMTTGN